MLCGLLFKYCFLLFLIELHHSNGQNIAPEQQGTQMERPHFGEKEDVYNEEHLKQHLEDKLELGEKKMSPEEERYHYFSINDLNKDAVIDGIEIWKAIHHSHDNHGQLQEPPASPMNDEQVEKAVDDVLKDIDLNEDGVIDYTEYIKKVEL